MKKVVTIADIADALGLSRNTVSKALNGQHVKPKTKQLVLSTAINMGYKNFQELSSKSILEHRRILILSSVPLLVSNYYIYLLKGITNAAERENIEVIQYHFRPHSNFESLNKYIEQMEVNGIICIEFFNEKMANGIISLNVPTVFLDYPATECNFKGYFDILLPENINAVSSACQLLIDKGVRNFCFVGYADNCKSFYERFLGMREALFRNYLPFSKDDCIIDSNMSVYNDVRTLAKRIAALNAFPECFVCTNDYIALKVLDALKILKKTNFEKNGVIGFDNGPESRLHKPKLSTISIDKETLGATAVHVLIERMENPQSPGRIIYTGTRFVNRETTEILNTKK